MLQSDAFNLPPVSLKERQQKRFLRRLSQRNVVSKSITTPLLKDGVITTSKLEDLVVEAAKLANSSVEAEKIANLAVGTAAIAALAVTSAKINDVAAGKITTGTITVAVNVGEGNIKLDGANKRITINDGTNDRILIGYHSGGF